MNGENKTKYSLTGNYTYNKDNIFLFTKNNSQIDFLCEEEINSIELEVLMDTGIYAYALCNECINEKDAQYKKIQNLLEDNLHQPTGRYGLRQRIKKTLQKIKKPFMQRLIRNNS